ncbi:MAG TPA: hypothetical protein VLX92_22245, partial [Kofleriaceae bacterium]|nr:hypothetical protein [Kofleriaceae bacterium]
ALAALGPLSPSGTPPPVVKAIAGSCSISLDIAGHVHPRVIVMPSKRCMIEGGDTSYVGARVRDVELSPDGGAVAVTLSVDDRFMEWTSTTEDTIVVPLR